MTRRAARAAQTKAAGPGGEAAAREKLQVNYRTSAPARQRLGRYRGGCHRLACMVAAMSGGNIKDLLKPGSVNFMLTVHDNWCPGAHGRPGDCICNPVARIVGEAEFIAAVVESGRKARRAAARKARREGRA